MVYANTSAVIIIGISADLGVPKTARSAAEITATAVAIEATFVADGIFEKRVDRDILASGFCLLL